MAMAQRVHPESDQSPTQLSVVENETVVEDRDAVRVERPKFYQRTWVKATAAGSLILGALGVGTYIGSRGESQPRAAGISQPNQDTQNGVTEAPITDIGDYPQGYEEGEVGIDFPEDAELYVDVVGDTTEVIVLDKEISKNPRQWAAGWFTNLEGTLNSENSNQSQEFVNHMFLDPYNETAQMFVSEGAEFGGTSHQDFKIEQILDVSFESDTQRSLTAEVAEYDSGIYRSTGVYEFTLKPKLDKNGELSEWLVDSVEGFRSPSA